MDYNYITYLQIGYTGSKAGGFKYFWNFHPECLGEMIQFDIFDLRIRFIHGLVKNHQLDFQKVVFFSPVVKR